jgi:hypothetical protein
MKSKPGNTLLRKGAAVVIGMSFLACLNVRPAHGIHTEKLPGVGNHLPALDLTDRQGNEHRLEWTLPEPKATIIFFFESRCAGFRQGPPSLPALSANQAPFGHDTGESSEDL